MVPRTWCRRCSRACIRRADVGIGDEVSAFSEHGMRVLLLTASQLTKVTVPHFDGNLQNQILKVRTNEKNVFVVGSLRVYTGPVVEHARRLRFARSDLLLEVQGPCSCNSSSKLDRDQLWVSQEYRWEVLACFNTPDPLSRHMHDAALRPPYHGYLHGIRELSQSPADAEIWI
jgi:hypothetical protein